MAIAAGGFAYMDTNAVAASSAGEGAGVVTGYNVSNISFGGHPWVPGGVDNVYYNNHCSGGSCMPAVATTNVTFTLTAATPGAAQGTAPANVDVYLLDASNHPLSGHDAGCTVTSWTNGTDTPSATAGTGTVSCKISPETPIQAIKAVEVEANQ